MNSKHILIGQSPTLWTAASRSAHPCTRGLFLNPLVMQIRAASTILGLGEFSPLALLLLGWEEVLQPRQGNVVTTADISAQSLPYCRRRVFGWWARGSWISTGTRGV